MLNGQALLIAATATASVTAISCASGLLTGRGRHISRTSSWLTLLITGTAVGHMLVLLVIGDFSTRYVWQHSASYEPVGRRMSALLAGQEGSFLVWALLATGISAWTARRWAASRAEGPREAGPVHLTVSVIAALVLLFTVLSVPFQSFGAAFPTLADVGAPPEGRGLNPVLTNPWMPPHTLLTFAAYALIGLVFAIAVVLLLRAAQGRAEETSHWRRQAAVVTRIAWVLLSASLLTGIVWAYEEMTFGWFWSWDPVEASTLAVWLLLTAALHGGGEADAGRRQFVHAPLMLAMTFVAVVFTSFVTRSGLHPSVHAFASGPLGHYLGLFLAALVIAVAVLGVAAWRAVPAGSPRRPWMSWGAWALLAGALLILWGLAYPILGTLLDRAVELETGYFTLWGYAFAVVLLLLMGFGLQAAGGSRRDATLVLGFFVGLTVLAAVVKPTAGLELISAERRAVVGGLEAFLGRASLLTLVPPAVYALIAVGERWWSVARTTPPRVRLALTGSALVHIGAVVSIVGVTFATLLATSVTVGVSPSTGVGVGDGLEVTITAIDRSEHHDGVGTLVEERETVTVEVRSGDSLLASGQATLSIYPEREMGRHARVMLDRRILGDTQVIYQGVGDMRPDGVPVTVRRIPLVGLVWVGLALLVVGGLVTTAAGWQRARPQSHTEGRVRQAAGVRGGSR
jgi:cytochrome c-type biogenesis protein CcmF